MDIIVKLSTSEVLQGFHIKKYFITKRKGDYDISSTLSFTPNVEHECPSCGADGFVL